MITSEHLQLFAENGYVVVSGLFSPEEVESYTDHFMRLRAAGSYEGDMVADVKRSNDPLQKYPRMIHMHRWDDLTRRWMLDERLKECLVTLLGDVPYAVQTMLYFKPPGARGQALHQDNMYLQVKPGTCMAAWMALDPCDEENGCMQVVPGSHNWPVLCPVSADAGTSFTNITSPLPEGTQAVPVHMKAGDVLFFGGSLVHGSFPNISEDRFRRTLIAHYVEGDTQQLTFYDQPVLTMDGRELNLEVSPGGAPCGVWTDEGAIEMTGNLASAHAVE